MPAPTATIPDRRRAAAPLCGAPVDGCADPLVARVCALHHTLMRVADRVLAPGGLTASRLMLLKRVESAGEPPTVTWLSGQLALSTQAVSRMVGMLERQKLVRRRSRTGGGRSVFVELTAPGRHAIEEATVLLAEVSSELRTGMDLDRVHALESGLDLMLKNLKAFDESAAGAAQSSAAVEHE